MVALGSIRWLKWLWLASRGTSDPLLREVRVRLYNWRPGRHSTTRVLHPHDPASAVPRIVPDHGVSITL